MLLHVGAFRIDIDSQQNSFWHDLTPQVRLLCTLLIVFATALTPNGHWKTWAIYGVALTILISLSRMTLTVLFKRMAVESAFVSVVLLGTLFRREGQLLWQWGPLQITTVGLTVLGSVTLKLCLCLLSLNLLTLTTSVPALLNGLVILRTPPLLVAVLASMYRYLSILIDEFTSMRRAAISRNLMSGNSRSKRLVIGHTIGSLFIRTYERGERVYQAMLARGYTGVPPVRDLPKGGLQDIIALTLTCAIALIGQMVYLG